MYDMHYDLLTILYRYSKGEATDIDSLKKTYDNNIIGGIINLYFMSPEEMLEELGITKEECQDVKGMLKKSIDCLKDMQSQGIIPNLDFLYSIEGCDFLKSSDDLEELYDMGVRSILPVWNEPNKFGSGNRGDYGLTNEGIKLVEKAMDLGMIIDVSHACRSTFYDILDITRGYDLLIASHSNVRSLCNRDRNLTDEQLKALKNSDGYIGLFTNGNFLSKDNRNLTHRERQIHFLKHMHYAIDTIGFAPSKVVVATDDMNYHPDSSYHNLEAFPLARIADNMQDQVAESFGEDVANTILVENPKKLIKKAKGRS